MALRLQNVCCRYGGDGPVQITAVQDINLTVEQGELVGLVGHTGSGKSTLAQLICGLIAADGGEIWLDDLCLTGRKRPRAADLARHVGMVFQYPEHQLFEVDVFTDVCFGPKNLGLDQEEVRRRAEESLRLVGLHESYYEKSPFELSGGEKRRVAIAGVLAMQPEVLILDEPTAGLDPKGRDDILDQVAYLQKERQITVVLVSHSMEDVAKYVDRIIVMNHGEAAFDGTVREVFSHYKELEAIGLAAPQVTYLMHGLKERGFAVDENATTIEEAKASILRAFGKQEEN